MEWIVTGLTVVGAWLDLRKRTNGKGPLAERLNELHQDVRDVKEDLRDLKDDFRGHHH